MSKALESLFAACEELKASDVHVMAGRKPSFRVHGALAPNGDFRELDAAETETLALELGRWTMPPGTEGGDAVVKAELIRRGSLDGAATSAAGVRYRFNVYRTSDTCAIALRRLDARLRDFRELGLPSRLAEFCDEPDGLVVVTGPTGSGKSTTLATMIDRINHSRDGHIVTIEDPIEFMHRPDRCFVHQRQVGRDTRSFNDALVEAMRQDPDVILVGEVRDLATIRTALRAAETGHLVFTTLHAGDCAGAIERLVSVFPADEQNSARHQLALVLRGIFAQHLLPSPDGRRRPACELLVNTTACANLIATGRTAQIYTIIETGGKAGMRTLDQSLAELLTAGHVDERTALALSRNPDVLKRRLRLC